ncbi:MAG: hypothetical protein ACR2K6_00375 [Solirubrobacterales bacterium]
MAERGRDGAGPESSGGEPIREGEPSAGVSGSSGWSGEHEAAWETLKASLGAGHAAGGASEGRCLDFCPICRGAELLRASGPPELRGQLADLQREALMTFRALIDHYLERLDQEPEESRRVEQIPID